MLIVLHKHVPERNQHRFYTLSIEPNLFGAWSLIRSWGRIGAPGQERTSWHDTQEEAEQACQRLLQAKQRRGYCVPEDSAPAPLLPWLRNTSAPAPDPETLRRRLEGIPGSLWETLAEERQDRL